MEKTLASSRPSVFTFNISDVRSLIKMTDGSQLANSQISSSAFVAGDCHDDRDPSQDKEEISSCKEGKTACFNAINGGPESGCPPDFKYQPVDIQQWRDTGFAAYGSHYNGQLDSSMYSAIHGPSGGFWRPAYGGYPVSGPSTSGLSRESSRDDLTSVEGGQIFEYEERFRVDRRKLELMMIGRYDPIKEPALDFFQRVRNLEFALHLSIL